jgi:formylglycine-generating enzyme required for sulfatase activity
MYNIRFRYRNPHDDDRRLTLYADGVERNDPGEKYRIPLWLPPTGGGALRTATLMWTLYEDTSFLRIECDRLPPVSEQKGRRRSRYTQKAGWDDTADVWIDSVELVRVKRMDFSSPERTLAPEMVRIPGGSFRMGSRKSSEKDELPAHKVTVDTFYMAMHEVTNREFERFWPEHEKWRDGFSWRDEEPVIYVSWQDAARYCNWLSREAGLRPVYDEENWQTDMSANGFRLPTEAEWEYVATGRGEGRTYPWGDDEPQPMVQGNFRGKKALEVPDIMRSQQAEGTVVVGSFPRGASRDGVQDMAGNVAEWCSDWYQMYEKGEATNPVETRESHSRVIRGGSWGYYGCSQRARDREFNSAKYPGYIYIGLRVVLPEKGYAELEGGE